MSFNKSRHCHFILKTSLILLTSSLFFFSCENKKSSSTPQRELISLKPQFAKGFSIEILQDSSYNIVILNLEKTGDTLQVFNWKRHDIKRTACLSSTHVSLIGMLDKWEVIKGVSFAHLMKDSIARAMFEKGSIINLGGDKAEAEMVLAIQPEIFFVYPFGTQNFERYQNAGIPCLQIIEYLEPHPLGRTEWIKLFGLLLDEEKKANEIFESIKIQYLNAVVKDQETTRPTVFSGFYDGGNWYAPPGNSFAAKLIEDAGGHYIFADSIHNGNIILPAEVFIKKAQQADFFGKITYSSGPFPLSYFENEGPGFNTFKAFQSGDIFYCSTVDSDYHGKGVAEPHIMLNDLRRLFKKDGSDSLNIYFRKATNGHKKRA
jgi:iron complex transport system substrate-binding protein